MRPALARLTTPAIGLVLAAVLAAIACAPLFLDSGFLLTRGAGDSANLLFRVHQLLTTYAGGEFPARWMPDGAYGYGLPYFTYYASFSTHVAAWLKLAGFSYAATIKLAQAASIAVGAWAVYGWLSAWTPATESRVSARPFVAARPLAAAIAYTFAPFHLVNVYARGDSLAELWALALAPLALWAVERLGTQRSFGRVAALAAVVGLVICTHNVSALMTLPFIGLYGLWRLSASGSPSGWRDAGIGVAALAWGLALTAFFWLPALAETGAVQLASLTNGYFSYSGHFRSVDLVQSDWIFSYNQNPFAMGLTQTVAALAGLIAFLTRRERLGWREVFVLLGLAAMTFLITPWSEFLYANVPGLAYVQFPWRFLGPQALLTAVVTGWLLPADAELELRSGRRSLASISFMLVLGAALAASALGGLRLEFVPLADEEVTAARLNLFEQATSMIGNTANAEYLPSAVDPRPWTSSRLIGREPQPVPLAGAVSGRMLSRRASTQTWSLTAADNAIVALPTYWWPGWAASIDGVSVSTRAAEGLGFIAFDVPAGTHTIDLSLTDTPLRAASNAASGLALLAPLVVYAIRLRRSGRRWVLPDGARWSIAALLLAAVAPLPGGVLQAGRWSAGPGSWDVAPAGREARPLNIDSVILAFPHRDSLRYATGAELSGVVLTPAEPIPGETLHMALAWRNAGDATVVLTLWPPAAPVMVEAAPILSTTAALSAGADQAIDLAVRLPDALAPGVYWWTVELVGPGGSIAAVSDTGRERGRVFVSPFALDVATPAPTDSLADLGPLRLHTLTAQLRDVGVDVSALWSTAQPVGQDLALSYRLVDPAGQRIAQRDGQPGGGFLPTHDWAVGQAYSETVSLALGDDPAAGLYRVDVVAYQSRTLEPVGSASTTVVLAPGSDRADRVERWAVAPELGLEAIKLPATVEAGTTLTITARWLTGSPAPIATVHWSLVAGDGREMTGVDDELPGALGWPASAAVRGVMALVVPPNLPAGDYQIQVSTGAGLPQVVGSVVVTASTRVFDLPPLQRVVGATFAGEIALAGYDLVVSGARADLTLVFQALRAPSGDDTYFVHVVDSSTGALVAQVDAEPGGGARPTSGWLANEVLSEVVSLDLSGLTPGSYDLYVGWYDPTQPGAPRLAARDAAGARAPDDRIRLPDPIEIP